MPRCWRCANNLTFPEGAARSVTCSRCENVYPAEIENAIFGMEGVNEVAVIGIPSEKWGESPLAVVVRADDSVTEDAVLDHVSGKLARFKQPKKVEFVDVIPRNPTGKVLKRVLRDQFADVSAE